MLAVLGPRTHSRFNLTVMTVEKVAMEVMEVTEAMAIKVLLRGADGLIAHRFPAGVDAEAMVVEVALLEKNKAFASRCNTNDGLRPIPIYLQSSHKLVGISQSAPNVLHHLRWLCGVLLKVPIFSSPHVILTFSGCHKVKALMGAADQWRQELQCVREIERALDPQSPVAQNS
jgi:hypothetical protein